MGGRPQRLVGFGTNPYGELDFEKIHERLRSHKSSIRQLCARGISTVVLFADGTLQGTGQCGAELRGGVSPGGRGAKQVAVGWHHTIAVLSDGDVMGFGHDNFKKHDKGQLRMPSKAELNGRKVVQAAAGFLHSLLLLENGDVLAFGCNSSRECLVPTFPPGTRAVEVAAGVEFSLVLLSSGELLAFGSNNSGETRVPTYNTEKLARELAAAAQPSAPVPQHQVVKDALPTKATATSTPPAASAAAEVATDPSHSSAAAAASTLPATPQVPKHSTTELAKPAATALRHAAGIEEVQSSDYTCVQSIIDAVKPTKKASEHFMEEVKDAFPTIREDIITHYVEAGRRIVQNRLDEGKGTDLPPMQLWALVVYTMDVRALAGEDQNFYLHLNRALQSRSTAVLRRIRHYLYFLMECLKRIPPVQPDPSQPGLLFYRGISESKRAAIAAKYRQGQTIHWSGMSSVTSDLDIARQFAGSDGILFVITCMSARDVSELSAIPAEREALLLPNFRAIVVQPLQAPQADDELRISVVELLEQLGSEPQVDI